MELARAALHVGPGRMEVGLHPVPDLVDGNVEVQVERAAICGSDLHSIFDGLGFLSETGAPQPGRPGHEAVGMVVRSAAAELRHGDRVLVLDGGAFAERMSVPAALCVRLPAGSAADRMVTAQQLGGVLYGMTKFWPQDAPGDVATVIGAGPIGYLFAAVLRRNGFGTIIVSDLAPDRLAAVGSRGSCSADVTVLAPNESVVDATMAATERRGADLVIEAAGYDGTRAQAVHCVRTEGRVGFFGYPESSGSAPFPFADAFWRAPISLEIVRNAQASPGLACFHRAVQLIADDEVDIAPLLGTTYPLERITDALACARRREALKVHLQM